jgi:hypothetical protein
LLRSKTISLVAVAALAVSACGGDDDDGETVAVGNFASDICTAFIDWTRAIQQRQQDLQQDLGSQASPQEGKAALEGFLDDSVEASDDLVQDVEEAGVPDTENGEEAADALQQAAEDARSKLEDARADAEDLPTGSRQEFGDAADKFGDEVQSALEGVGNGLEQLDTPELDEAIEEESACQT